MFEIDGSLIVGINKTKIPQFTSLIEIGHSRKTIQHPRTRQCFAEISEIIKKGVTAPGLEYGLEEFDHRSLMRDIRLASTDMSLVFEGSIGKPRTALRRPNSPSMWVGSLTS
jgi:hypothetical protein